MIKLQTPVAETPCTAGISYSDRILLLGSCFSDSIGKSLIDYGFDAMVNPFGTLYNPASICFTLKRLATGREFTQADCVPMGALPKGGRKGSESAGGVSAYGESDENAPTSAAKICSFSHHTSFARPDSAAFLENANASLRAASEFFRSCNKVIITLGTAWCFKYIGSTTGSDCSSATDSGTPTSATGIHPSNLGWIVSNCLKRDAREFSRERLSTADCILYLNDIVDLCSGPNRRRKHCPTETDTRSWQLRYGPAWAEFLPKDIIFTVSPIRHLADGAHGNQLSKSTLLLAVDQVISRYSSNRRPASFDPHTSSKAATAIAPPHTTVLDYFPAYEIMMDELRDYRFWAEDMVHPSAQAVAHITDRFLSRHLFPADRPRLEASIRAHRRSLHRPIL